MGAHAGGGGGGGGDVARSLTRAWYRFLPRHEASLPHDIICLSIGRPAVSPVSAAYYNDVVNSPITFCKFDVVTYLCIYISFFDDLCSANNEHC